MLVLARQRDQTVIIGDDIEVTVVDVRGDKVRLGISAPKHVSVHRKEVYEAIRRENQAAARVRPEDVPALGPRPTNTPGGNPGRPTPQAVSAHRPFLQAAVEEAREGLDEG